MLHTGKRETIPNREQGSSPGWSVVSLPTDGYGQSEKGTGKKN